MANFKTHLIGSISFGLVSSIIFLEPYDKTFKNISLCLLFALIGGFLPDIDSKNSISKRIIFTILALFCSSTILVHTTQDCLINYRALLKCFLIYLFIRYGFSSLLHKFTVHRGIFHSIPIMLCWSFGISIIIHPVNQWIIALSISSGFLSHLILDELYSVNLENLKLKKSFGTALKFSSSNNIATFFSYILTITLYMQMPSFNEFIEHNKYLYYLKDNFQKMEHIEIRNVKTKFFALLRS
jgi:hypothetical protein